MARATLGSTAAQKANLRAFQTETKVEMPGCVQLPPEEVLAGRLATAPPSLPASVANSEAIFRVSDGRA